MQCGDILSILNHTVVLYGDKFNDLRWRSQHTKSPVYHATGFVIQSASKLYIVTTRTRLISCQDIVAYYIQQPFSSNSTNDAVVLRNELHIIFQSFEFNIIILATNNCDSFEPHHSTVVNDKIFCDLFGETNIKIRGLTPESIPKKNKIYHYLVPCLDLNEINFNGQYQNHLYDVKFKNISQVNIPSVPHMVSINFNIGKNIQSGVFGAPVFDNKHIIIGFINYVSKKVAHVLPAEFVFELVSNMEKFKPVPQKYNHIFELPFMYECHKNNVRILHDAILPIHPHGENYVFENDIILSVLGSKIVIIDNHPHVYDEKFGIYLLLEAFIKYNHTVNEPFELVISRNNKIVKINMIIDNCRRFTGQPYFMPNNPIPYLQIGPFIVVEMTYELNLIMRYHKVNITNYIDNNFGCHNHDKFIIIDCLDPYFSDKYAFIPHLLDHRKKINCPVLDKINDQEVGTFDFNKLAIFVDNLSDHNVTLSIIHNNKYFSIDI